MKDSESRLQAQCVAWLWNTYPRTRGLLLHIPNGGLRSPREAATLKAMGVIAGMPDLCLAIPVRDAAALYIEMKTKSLSQLSDAQKKSHIALSSAGNIIETALDFEHFKNIIHIYLRDTSWLNQSDLSENLKT